MSQVPAIQFCLVLYPETCEMVLVAASSVELQVADFRTDDVVVIPEDGFFLKYMALAVVLAELKNPLSGIHRLEQESRVVVMPVVLVGCL